MRITTLVLLIFLNEMASAQDKTICITIDDLPVVSYSLSSIEHKRYITKAIVQTLKEMNVPAIGFVNERGLYTEGKPDPEKVALLETWLENGLELGNHTFSHPDYHKTAFEDYTADILQGEKLTAPLVERYGKDYRYFRHPFLRIGERKGQYDSLQQFLAGHGYVEAPVTIDNADYLFAKAYHNALLKDKKDLMKQIGQDYLDYMVDKVLFYEKASEELFIRNIPHILLLHANRLNADYLDDLLERYQQLGYTFTDLETTLEDPAYQSKITKFSNWGISWIDRWAMSRGKLPDLYKEDPPVPEYVEELAAR
jgi:peptidoglycan/xylan/chitin deacetylase (PgdA/CDA1 family)